MTDEIIVFQSFARIIIDIESNNVNYSVKHIPFIIHRKRSPIKIL
jgi:hypothetical protein